MTVAFYLAAAAAAKADTPKWTDVAGFIATSAGVLVTLAAVLVALFGPRWQARRLMPSMTITLEAHSMSWAVKQGDGYRNALGFYLHNETGQDTARDVEVFVSAEGKLDDGSLSIAANGEPLVFHNPLSGEQPRTVSNVPSGFNRQVRWCLVGEPTHLGQSFGRTTLPLELEYLDAVAAVYVDPSSRNDVAWMLPGVRYAVTFIITGSNFDAVYFDGIFGGKLGTNDHGQFAAYEWIEAPKQRQHA
jgi:hypothetical protein